MTAFVSSISRFFSVFALTPIKGEHVLAPFPGPVLELDADAGVLKPLEHGDCHFVAETVPKLKPVERLHRRLRGRCLTERLVAGWRVERHSHGL
jgi:hypothetical protein